MERILRIVGQDEDGEEGREMKSRLSSGTFRKFLITGILRHSDDREEVGGLSRDIQRGFYVTGTTNWTGCSMYEGRFGAKMAFR